MIPPRRLAVGLVVVLAACGGSNASTLDTPAQRVPLQLVPAELAKGSLVVNEDRDARKAFGNAGVDDVVADGRVYAIRGAGNRLVGTLQLTTVLPQVDFGHDAERRHVASGIVSSSEEISVGQIKVLESRTTDKTVYVWFGDDIYEVLQLKPTTAVSFEPESILTELIDYQMAKPEWRSLRGRDRVSVIDGDEEDDG